MIRILLADGEELVREGLRILLDAEPGLCVVAAVGEGKTALIAAAETDPAVALLDRDLPGPDGLATAHLLGVRFPALAVIVVATFPDAQDAVAARQAGAFAYLPKGQESESLIAIIRAAALAEARSATASHY